MGCNIGMEHCVIIHQKEGRDLYDYYPTEDAAKAALQAISDAVRLGTRSIVTPSGKVTFEVANYAGAERKTEDSDERGDEPWGK